MTHPSPRERDAARRYLEHDHAAQTLRGRPAEEANRQAEEIDERHARARDIALTGTARELGELPPHLRRHQAASRQQAGITTEQAREIRNHYRAHPAEDSEPDREPDRRDGTNPRPDRRDGTNPRPNRRDQAAGAASTAASYGSDLVSSAKSTSWGQTIATVFTWGVGLSIAYLLLSGGSAGALSGFSRGVTSLTRAAVSPVIDPLNPHGHPAPRPIAPAKK